MTIERKIYDAAFKIKAVELINERFNLSEFPVNQVFVLVCIICGVRIKISLIPIAFLGIEF